MCLLIKNDDIDKKYNKNGSLCETWFFLSWQNDIKFFGIKKSKTMGACV